MSRLARCVPTWLGLGLLAVWGCASPSSTGGSGGAGTASGGRGAGTGGAASGGAGGESAATGGAAGGTSGYAGTGGMGATAGAAGASGRGGSAGGGGGSGRGGMSGRAASGGAEAGGSGGNAGGGGAGGVGQCPSGRIWCPGCTPGTGACYQGGCPGAGCPPDGGAPDTANPTCGDLTTQAACDLSSDCHAVFDDPQTCRCAAIGCCARFSWCADGDRAKCKGAPTCERVTPHCEGPYVVSYTATCYEGCVRATECAP